MDIIYTYLTRAGHWRLPVIFAVISFFKKNLAWKYYIYRIILAWKQVNFGLKLSLSNRKPTSIYSAQLCIKPKCQGAPSQPPVDVTRLMIFASQFYMMWALFDCQAGKAQPK